MSTIVTAAKNIGSTFGRRLARLSLQSKFILITALAIILFMAVIGYVAVEREKYLMYAEIEKKGRVLGETLAIPIINDLIYEKLGLVEEGGLIDNYIMEIFSRKDVDLLYITILDEEGKVISHNNITEYGKLYTDELTRKALQASRTVVQQFSVKGHDALDFGVPLSIGNKRWGTLKFGLSLEAVEQEIAGMVKNIIIFTLVLIGIGFIIILLLSRRFIKPITSLASTMEKTDADLLDAKVKIKGHDELAMLGERFNSMIDRIKQANEELKKAHEKMIQSEKLASIGILASGVAHEINNPLGGLFNCLRMLRQNDDPAFREKYLGLINEGLERIENTVNKLLWMSRKAEHIPVDVNVKNAVESVYSFIEYRLKKGRIAFANEVPADLRFQFDMHDLQQLLLNLFINAVHAMDQGGTLRVRGSRDNGTVRIKVIDNGCGIAQEHIGRIFDPFFTTKAPGEGTGLGLWLTYEIVRNYNGEISVESERGKGSTFTISIPVQQSL
ncbi:MAG: ATP-binding protein [Nitrospirota bacterium]